MLRVVLVACLVGVGAARVVLPSTPPKGFNTFDHFNPGTLNESSVLAIADTLVSQLLPHGYNVLTLDGGWSASSEACGGECLDKYGRTIPNPKAYPNMTRLVAEVHRRGLKVGLWTMRGVHTQAVEKKLRVKGTPYTVDQLVDVEPVGGGANGSCLWNKGWLGVNRSHPAAQAYYDSRAELFAEWGVDFIKADCMMCEPCYKDELEMFTEAVRKVDRDIMLSYSPGGGNNAIHGKWVAQEKLSTMYRIVTDFHGGWYGWGGLQQAIFIAGNFSRANLAGANGTWPDLDMLPLDAAFYKTQESHDRGQTIATLWMIAKSPLMHAGTLPVDHTTLNYETNQDALAVHDHGKNNAVQYYSGNCTCKGNQYGSCTLPKDPPFVGKPCVATWTADVPGETPWKAVAILNMGEVEAEVTTHFSKIGLTLPSYNITDVWDRKSLGVKEMSFTVTLRPHASTMLKIHK